MESNSAFRSNALVLQLQFFIHPTLLNDLLLFIFQFLLEIAFEHGKDLINISRVACVFGTRLATGIPSSLSDNRDVTLSL